MKSARDSRLRKCICVIPRTECYIKIDMCYTASAWHIEELNKCC